MWWLLILVLFITRTPGAVTDIYPASAHLCTWANRGNLQADIDQYAATVGLRLEPGKDYNNTAQNPGGPTSVTVGSGMRIYALNSRICPITISAGSHDVYLSGLSEGTITCAPGAEISRVTLNRVHYLTLQGTGCRLDEFTWFDAYNTNIAFDCSAGGYVRNFRVIRDANQNNTQPFKMVGNAAEPSYGNSIVIGNYLTGDSPEGPRVYLNQVREWLSIQIGAESYSSQAQPWFTPRDVAFVRSIGTGGLVDFGHVWETNAPNVCLVGDQMATFFRNEARCTTSTYHFQPGVASVVAVSTAYPVQAWDPTVKYRRYASCYRLGLKYRARVGYDGSDPATDINVGHDPATSPTFWESQAWVGFETEDDNDATAVTRATFFDVQTSDAKTVRVNGAGSPTSLAPSAIAAIRRTAGAPSTGLVPWDPPAYGTPPSDFTALPLSSITRGDIQAQLDDVQGTGAVLLPAGIYRLDGPLKLGTRPDGRRRILIGAGKGQTVLRGADGATDVIQEANDGAGSSSIDLISLTLQGGRWGINLFSKQVAGAWVQRQYLDSMLNNICIRDMQAGGVHLENIYGMDNNAFQGVDFVRCPIGWQQIGGTDPSNNTWAYMDKNLWSGCQWLQCDVALDLRPTRASGGNVFLENRFEGCASAIMVNSNHDPVSFINCDLVDNGGDPMIFDYGQCFFISTRIHDGGTARSVYDGYVGTFEGCTFTRSGASDCVVISTSRPGISGQNIFNQYDYNGRCTHFLNSQVDMPIGQWYNGSALNSRFTAPGDRALGRVGAIVYADADAPRAPDPRSVGAPLPADRLHYRVLDPTQPTPGPSVLLSARAFQDPLTPLPAGIPSITSSGTMTATWNQPTAFQMTASGNPTVFTARGLPPGLEVDAAGRISGTPSASGIWTAAITAGNAAGRGAAWLTIQVLGRSPGAPELPSLPDPILGATNAAMSQALTATGATAYGAKDLPPGLTLDPVSGVLSGTPAAAGTFTARIEAANGQGTSVFQIHVQIVAGAPVFRSIPDPITGQVGTALEVDASALGATSYAVDRLPGGLSLNAASGRITGSPTAAGSTQATLQASGPGGSTSTVIRFVVAAAPVKPPTAEPSSGGSSGSCSHGGGLAILALLVVMGWRRCRGRW